MYQHPIFDRQDPMYGVSVFDLDKQEVIMGQGTLDSVKIQSLEEYIKDFAKAEQMRVKLGIPRMAYHAYGFPSSGYDVQHVRNVIEWARGHDLEVRSWVNLQSGLLLIVIPDPDLSENSGWKLNEYVREYAKSYESYGMASWYEFCQYGVPIPSDWQLIERNNLLFASASDGKKFVTLGR